FRAPRGSAVALAGLRAGPLAILVVLATLYESYGNLPLVQAIIAGGTAASAGLVLGTVIKLGRRLCSTWCTLLICVLVFLAATVLHLHVLVTVLLMIPLSLVLTIWERRR